MVKKIEKKQENSLLDILTIYREEDAHYIYGMLETIPKYCKVFLVKTVKVKGRKKYEITDIVTDGRCTMAVMEYSGTFDFSKARNTAQTLCKSDWIFHLDSDDRLLISQFEDIKLMLEQAHEDVYGLTVNVLNWCRMETPDKSTQKEMQIGWQLKLIRNKNILWESKIHETTELSILRLKKLILKSPILVHHIGYELPSKLLGEKMKRNIRGLMSSKLIFREKHWFNLLTRDYNILMNIKEDKYGKF